MRLVVDTNIMISALGWRGQEYTLMNMIFEGEADLYFSPEILSEFQKVAKRPRFGFTGDDIEEYIVALLEIGTLVVPENRVEIIKVDLSDNMFLECALEVNADYLVSGDEHLLKLKEFKSTRIVKAGKVLQHIEKFA